MKDLIKGFSKLSRDQKIRTILDAYAADPAKAEQTIRHYLNSDLELQRLHESFAENTLTNYYMPLGIAPNFRINGRYYAIPMAIEESSVVAALSKSASFWAERGGFEARVLSMIKKGQIHLIYTGADKDRLLPFFENVKEELVEAARPVTEKMQARGGGILSLELLDKTDAMKGYFQIDLSADTKDSMGANFINSVLESIAQRFKELFAEKGMPGDLEIVMSILSNYTPDSRVRVSVSCPIDNMAVDGFSGEDFCRRFAAAVRMAALSVDRAVTHNKGIMNGVDAVIVATGNDFRAVEACVHAYAARDGQYTSLSQAWVENGEFHFAMEIPMAVGTVGGLTRLHPLAALSMELLGNPSAGQLMEIAACVGLAQNFSAVRSLITSGIQRGHMKMHLGNILRTLGATEKQEQAAKEYFSDKTVSFRAVEEFLAKDL